MSIEEKKIEATTPPTQKPWSDFHNAKYMQLKNYLLKTDPNLNAETFIDDKKQQLVEIIEANPKWGESNTMGLFFTIARWLNNRNHEDPFIKIFSQKGYDIQQKIKKDNEENTLDEKELENYRDYAYFENIVKSKESGPSIRDHFQYLLLSCLILHPPLRTSFYTTASFIDKMTDDNNKNNFVCITTKRGKPPRITFIVNDDKVSNARNFKADTSLKIIEVESQVLADMIVDSLKRFPRRYLFENPKSKTGFTDNALLKMIRQYTHLPGINFQMFRSIYITWFYKHHQRYASRAKLAKQMRHSIDTASRNYLKIFDEDEGSDSDKPSHLEGLLKENFELKEMIKELKSKSDSDDDKPVLSEDQLFNKRRADCIYRYNKKQVKPSQKTIDKYRIKTITSTEGVTHYE